MKKLFAMVCVTLLFAIAVGSAFADNTGCGLGRMIWQGKADTILFQSFEFTTNATFGSQSFGITFGTSECDKPSKFVKNDRVNEFVVANMDNLAKDIAMGRGETLDAFADLMQIPAEKRTEFNQKLQTAFTSIFTSENVVLANVVDNIVTVSEN